MFLSVIDLDFMLSAKQLHQPFFEFQFMKKIEVEQLVWCSCNALLKKSISQGNLLTKAILCRYYNFQGTKLHISLMPALSFQMLWSIFIGAEQSFLARNNGKQPVTLES